MFVSQAGSEAVNLIEWPVPAKPASPVFTSRPVSARRKAQYCAFYSEASSGELINRYTSANDPRMDNRLRRSSNPDHVLRGARRSMTNSGSGEQNLRAMEKLNPSGARRRIHRRGAPRTPVRPQSKNYSAHSASTEFPWVLQSMDEITCLDRRGAPLARKCIQIVRNVRAPDLKNIISKI